jgi:hypothetical protein
MVDEAEYALNDTKAKHRCQQPLNIHGVVDVSTMSEPRNTVSEQDVVDGDRDASVEDGSEWSAKGRSLKHAMNQMLILYRWIRIMTS